MSISRKNKVAYILLPIIYIFVTLQGFVSPAKAADTPSWTSAKGTQVAPESIVWSSRIEFLAPNRIRDKTTNTIYETTKEIWGDGNDPYLRNHDGDGDSNYWFTPLDAEGKDIQWAGTPGGTCLGIFVWYIHGDGSKSDLYAVQPSKSGDSSECTVGGKSLLGGSKIGRQSDSEQYKIARLGEESDTPDDWKGNLPHVRNAVSAYYWASDSKIGIFDSGNSFSLATGQRRDDLLKAWKKADDSGVSQADRDNGALWETWTHSKCQDEFLIVAKRTTTASGTGYLIDKDGGIVDISGPKCLTDRDMDYENTVPLQSARDLINLNEKWVGLSYTENGVLPASEVDPSVAGVGDNGSSIDDPQSCETLGGAFSFILCPLLKIMDKSVSWFDDRITAALNVNASYYSTPGVKGAWANFRNIAYILLIPILLVMVISTALGFSFVDAYTVKRALPRLIIAIIFIALSFEIAKLLVEISNIVGQGTAGLIAAPFGGMDNLKLSTLFQPSAGSDALFAGGAVVGGVIAYLSGVTIWGIAITIGLAVLSMMIVFIILTVREMIIIFLMILAPIAILSWIFPGNDKLWKIWWGTFSKMLIFFPLVMALIVSGRAFASIVRDTGADEAIVISTMIKLIAFVGPYFFIPAAFKFAGGALGSLAGMVNNKSKGVFDRGKKLRGDLGKSKRHRIAEGNAFRNTPDHSLRNRINTLGKKAYLAPTGGLSAKNRRAAYSESEIAEFKKANEDGGLQSVIANDDQAAAGMHGRGTHEDALAYLTALHRRNDNGDVVDNAGNILRTKKDAAGNAILNQFGQEELEEGQGDARKYTDEVAKKLAEQTSFAKRRVGAQTFKSQAVVAMAGSKTSFRGGPAQMLAAIAEASEGDAQLGATLYAAARAKAEQAQRTDLSAYSYGAGLGVMNNIMNANTDAEKQNIADNGNDSLLLQGLHGKSSAAIWGSHGTSVKNHAQVLHKQYKNAASAKSVAVGAYASASMTGAPPDELARLKRDADVAHQNEQYALAEIANANDQIAYFAPENADYFNEEVYGQKIAGTDETIQNRVDKARTSGDDAFRRRTRALSEAELQRAGMGGGVIRGPGT